MTSQPLERKSTEGISREKRALKGKCMKYGEILQCEVVNCDCEFLAILSSDQDHVWCIVGIVEGSGMDSTETNDNEESRRNLGNRVR